VAILLKVTPSSLTLVLLPGMDGTGVLFNSFIAELGEDFTLNVVRYPDDRRLAYPALVELVRSSLPTSEPYVLLAESFSTPIAILCAARPDANLRGLILCAGFAHSPVPKWLSPLATLLRPAFCIPLPDAVSRWLLLGNNVNSHLLLGVRNAVASVKSEVLTHRLRAIIQCDVRRELGSTSVPLLYIRGIEDRLIGLRSVEKIRSVRPDILLAEVDAPHLILQRRPGESAEIVRAFVRQLI
jgi:pimeloyl-[acyl-carrier protein] methyl ester esterase